MKTPKSLNSRQAHWTLFFMCFDFTLSYPRYTRLSLVKLQRCVSCTPIWGGTLTWDSDRETGTPRQGQVGKKFLKPSFWDKLSDRDPWLSGHGPWHSQDTATTTGTDGLTLPALCYFCHYPYLNDYKPISLWAFRTASPWKTPEEVTPPIHPQLVFEKWTGVGKKAYQHLEHEAQLNKKPPKHCDLCKDLCVTKGCRKLEHWYIRPLSGFTTTYCPLSCTTSQASNSSSKEAYIASYSIVNHMSNMVRW